MKNTIKETLIDGYATTYSTDMVDGVKTITVTNTYEPDKTSVVVKKEWIDNDNASKKRPDAVMVTLYADGVQAGPSIYLSEKENNWEYIWTNLSKYKDDDQSKGEIKYTVKETVPDEYKESYKYEEKNGIRTITIKNTYVAEKTSIKVVKK